MIVSLGCGYCQSSRANRDGKSLSVTVEVVDKHSQLGLQVGDGQEISPAHHFAVDDPEDDLDLVEPRTVFRGVHEPDPVVRQGQKPTAAYLRLQDALPAFDPSPLNMSLLAVTPSASGR